MPKDRIDEKESAGSRIAVVIHIHNMSLGHYHYHYVEHVDLRALTCIVAMYMRLY